MADNEDFTRIWKRLADLEKSLKETNRLHKILDEYCTDGFKEVYAQIGKNREDLTKVLTAVAAKKK